MSEPSLPEKVTAVHDRLDRAGIPHAFGGAMALAYYAEPRTTIDIDLNVFLPPQDYPRVREALEPIGVGDDVDAAALEREGQCRLWWGRNPVDLFFASIPLHEAMRRHIRTVPFGEDELPILAPEHLAACKAIFNRAKDWLDIEQILVSVEHLDTDEVERWLDEILGAGDPRARRFDRLARELRGG